MSFRKKLQDWWPVTVVAIVVASVGVTWGVFTALVADVQDNEIKKLERDLAKCRAELSALQDHPGGGPIGSAPAEAIGASATQALKATGNIVVPKEDGFVGSGGRLRYEIEIDSPVSGRSYYVALETGDDHWPVAKIDPLPNGGRVSGIIDMSKHVPQHIQIRLFFLVLYEVEPEAHDRIQQWLSGSRAAGTRIKGNQLARRRVQWRW